MAGSDLKVVSVPFDSRDEADAAVDELDERTEAGGPTASEIAVVYRTAKGKVRVQHVHRHGTVIGAAIGAGWAALGAAGTIATGGLALPILLSGAAIGVGVDTGIGAAIGHAVSKHRRPVTDDFLKDVAAKAQAGKAVLVLAADPAAADALLADLSGRYADVQSIQVDAAEQEATAKEVVASQS